MTTGATLAEISARRQVSVNTLQVQLARLFAEVGVHRQADLVRRAMELRETPGAEGRSRADGMGCGSHRHHLRRGAEPAPGTT